MIHKQKKLCFVTESMETRDLPIGGGRHELLLKTSPLMYKSSPPQEPELLYFCIFHLFLFLFCFLFLFSIQFCFSMFLEGFSQFSFYCLKMLVLV